jgi:hypothetical protein
MANQPQTVLAILTDLFFRVKIEDGAKRSGLVAVFATTEKLRSSTFARNARCLPWWT